MHHPRALLIGLVLLVSALAGCTSRGDGIGTGGDIVPPTATSPSNTTAPPSASFQIAQLAILAPDGAARPLYEDDGEAIVRYVVAQPADAGKAETAFVTYLLNGRIMDVQQLKLKPGEEKVYERRVSDLRATKTLHVEVRAASAVAKADATVLSWPRAGQDELLVGPLAIRVPYGLMEQDGRVLVNLSVEHRGPEQPLRDLRVKMLCLAENGTIVPTRSVPLAIPQAGTTGAMDALVDNCQHGYYGLELKAHDATSELAGRLLLVPKDWRPPQA